MTHIAFSEPLPICWPTDGYADSLVSQRLVIPFSKVVDNRTKWMVAKMANDLGCRAEGRDFSPFTLEERK